MSEGYEDILKRQWANVPKVKVLPVGTWRLKAKNASFQKAKEEGKNASFMFVYEPKQALDDVDESQLADLGAEYDLANNRIFFRLWYETSRDLDALRSHLAKHGVDVEQGTIEDALKAVKGREINCYLDKRTFQANGGEMVTDNDPKSFTPVAD